MKKEYRRLIKLFLPKRLIILIRKMRGIMRRLDIIEKNQQNMLQDNYKLIAEESNQKINLRNKEFQIHSQNGEDGILLYIFSKIGVSNRCFVEFGIENGKECNTANLSINFGWHGLLMDGDKKDVISAKEYYKNRLEIRNSQIKIVRCFVTKENINNVLLKNGISGEIDLLSIDIDGNDYWVWKAINVIKPRVVVMEYNASFGLDKSLTIKYSPNFDRYKKHSSGLYHGASLSALTKLAKSKGYILVGCDSTGCNAFFVSKEAAKKKLPEFNVKEAYYPHSRRLKELSLSEQFECIKHLDFERI